MGLRDVIRDAHEKQQTDAPSAREIVVDVKTGQARQAGATTPEGAFISELKVKAEQSLFVFTKGIIGRPFVIPSLHKPLCDYLQRRPPYRKGALLPREHVKSVIVGQCLPPHILIQPKGGSYFPDDEGSEAKIMLGAETMPLAQGNLRVVRHAFTGNQRMRAFWPHRCWGDEKESRRLSQKWNEIEIIIPRADETRDASVVAVGVGGAATGLHPNVFIKDDIIALEAANSPTVMETAWTWHKSTRGMMNRDDALEFIIGTRWAVGDVYQRIQEEDFTVEWYVKAIVENGACIFPRDELPPKFRFLGWDLAKVAAKKIEMKELFSLLYMNSISDPELTDFNDDDIRSYIFDGESVEFDEDDRDLGLMTRYGASTIAPPNVRGRILTRDNYNDIFTRGEYFRARST